MLFLRNGTTRDMARLAEELDRLLLGSLFRKYRRYPRELIHYTSVEAFRAILSSGNLRMSHFRFLNDSTEVLHGRQIAEDMMAAEVEKRDRTSGFFDFVRFAARENAESVQYFLSSFSVLHDDAELWRRYGDNACGVAIVFDTRRMGAEREEPYIYHIGRVTYTPAEQTELLASLFTAAKTILAKYIVRHGYDVRDVAVQMLAAKLGSSLVHHGVALKSEEWSVEQEWRTVFSLLANDDAHRHARVQRRWDGRPYVDIRIRSTEPDEEMPIIKVVVGVHGNEIAVRDVLNSCGYNNVPIVRSSVIF
jgi:Protein of unknown function (DUF2971)